MTQTTKPSALALALMENVQRCFPAAAQACQEQRARATHVIDAALAPLIAERDRMREALVAAERRVAEKVEWIDRNGSGSIFDADIQEHLEMLRTALAETGGAR